MPWPARSRAPLPKIRGTQIGLLNPGSVDQLKSDMKAGRFAYAEERGQISGVRDLDGTYYVMVGHHRMAAAMEIYRENGDTTAVLELLRWGKWDGSRPGTPRSTSAARAGRVGRVPQLGWLLMPEARNDGARPCQL